MGPNLSGYALQEVDGGVTLEVRWDWEEPGPALLAVAAESCLAGVRPVDTRRHAEHDKVEVYSDDSFVEYVEEQAHVLADVR